MSKVTVKIENAYDDGHESTHDVEVDAPTDIASETEDWWNEVVFPHTGDGHGIDGLGSCYTATITAADDPALVGETTEWID